MAQLTQKECKLLQSEQLVDRFNAVDQILADAVNKLPRFADREVVTKVKTELLALAETMTRERFSIGFIGPSQAGKSTTVGNLLAVSKDECPAPQGTGGPTTSIPTRLIPVLEPSTKCQPGETHLIELQFLTKAQFRDRVRDICRLIKLPFDDNLRMLLDAAARQNAEQPHFKAADHVVLIGLLKAAAEFSDVIQEAPKIELGAFSKRRDYATHQEKPTKYTLLREVRIYYVTDAMSLDIDMIDLPGLGVDKESDDALTLAFLPYLDGAFMFQESSQVKSSAISQLAEPMREQHKNTLGGRVWMVVTKCDSLNELQITGPPEDPTQPSVFCHLNDTLHNQGLGDDAIIFVGNAYYQALLALPKQSNGTLSLPPEAVRSRFQTVAQFDEKEQPIVPSRCLRYPGQVEPWRRFVLDGGLSYLRETMQSKVAESVRNQTRQFVTAKLTRIVENLISAMEIAEQQSGMTIEQMRAATLWSGRLSAIAHDVSVQPQFIQPLVEKVENNMNALLEGWGMPADRKLSASHASLSRVLARAGADESGKQTLQMLMEVKTTIEEHNVQQPAPDAPGLATPLQHWASVSEEYLELGRAESRTDYRQGIFNGIESDPSPFEGGGQQSLSPNDYVDVMRRKIQRTSHVFGTRLIHEVRHHLEKLASRYRSVGDEVDRIDPGAKSLYSEFRSRLTAIR